MGWEVYYSHSSIKNLVGLKMKVLLTGASGFVGQHILSSLIRHGIDVVTIGRTQAHTHIEFIQADLLQIENFSEVIEEAQATHLIHCAWYTQHGDYWTSTLNLRWLEASLKLIECFCLQGGRHVTVAGTCAEYDWSYGYLNEELTPLKPQTFYGVTKKSLCQLTMQLCAHYQVQCAWGRIYYSFGPGENPKRLIPSLIKVFKEGASPFTINSFVYRDFLHVYDIAEAFVYFVLAHAHGEYNISSAEPTRLDKIVQILASQFNANPEPILALAAQKVNEPQIIVGTNSKIKALGWEPLYSLEHGLKLVSQGI